MIEPQQRRYEPAEQARLVELFGDAPRWGETLRPFLWTHVGTVITGFTGDHRDRPPDHVHLRLRGGGGQVPARARRRRDPAPAPLLRHGVPRRRPTRPASPRAPVAWHEEASFRLPVRVWRDVMDRYFPNSGWVRLSPETLDALTRFKAARALPTWDETLEQLLKEAGEEGA